VGTAANATDTAVVGKDILKISVKKEIIFLGEKAP
jgi:hypothetical protein